MQSGQKFRRPWPPEGGTFANYLLARGPWGGGGGRSWRPRTHRAGRPGAVPRHLPGHHRDMTRVHVCYKAKPLPKSPDPEAEEALALTVRRSTRRTHSTRVLAEGSVLTLTPCARLYSMHSYPKSPSQPKRLSCHIGPRLEAPPPPPPSRSKMLRRTRHIWPQLGAASLRIGDRHTPSDMPGVSGRGNGVSL